ncbi:hypothetical protein [Paenibacillus crassostreae]|uniref:Uncharacterized protein n=1 Tax=Paenibacillus crassostreae TaxID=1763538 RepID=A0A167DPB3_9BACL|nr:hypothetical protein [Paenibacillus crassostreae]AOZ91221.1 hypothetical protein LPB68_02685 [Paenibacillus crassostreae]OAB74621.1 hypothetical protein PNBC_11275 [Paenibacillus crassostreae]
MKKNIVIIFLSIIIVLLFVYMFLGKSVEYEVVAIEDAPTSIQAAIRENNDKLRFSIFQDGTNTYIYYKTDHAANEYITTDLVLKVKGGKYIAAAEVTYAVNDGNVNYDKLIKLEKVLDKDILLTEKNTR